MEDVKVVIIVGLTAKANRQIDPAAMSGWFVYCNGRLVLEGDKTKTMGWGDGLQQWHSKFNRFVGFVFFDSENSFALPWTTTKSGLADDAEITEALKKLRALTSGRRRRRSARCGSRSIGWA